MLWTPASLPPHPSTVPSLSPLAQKMIELIREETRKKNSGQQSRPTGQYRATLCNNAPPSSLMLENTLHSSNIEDSVMNGGSHFSNNLNTVRDIYTSGRMTSGPLYEQYKRATLIQDKTPFNSEDITMNKSMSNFDKNVQLSLETAKLHPQNNCGEFDFNEPFRPVNNNNQKTFCGFSEQLSPDMEFDNMEIFSVPHADVKSVPKSLEQLKPIIKSNITPSSSSVINYSNSINLENTNKKDDAKRMKLFNNTSDMEPTDQTFIINEKPNQQFKNKLQKYKITNKNENNNLRSAKINQKHAGFESLQTNNIKAQTIINRENINEGRKFVITPRCKADIIPSSAGLQIEMEKINDSQSQSDISDSLIEKTMDKYLNDTSCSVSETWTTNNLLTLTEDKSKEIGQVITVTTQTLSEPVESLFVKTQEFDVEISNHQDANFQSTQPLEFSEETNVAPVQQMEHSDSPSDFLVDDLFSSDGFSPKATEDLLNVKKCYKHKNEFTLNIYRDEIAIDNENKGDKNNSIVGSAQYLSSVTQRIEGTQFDKSRSDKYYNPIDNFNYEVKNIKIKEVDAFDILFGNKEKPSQNTIKKENNQKSKITGNIKTSLKNKTESEKEIGNRNDLIEVNNEIYKRKITKPINLKQTTLFDCRKFLPSKENNCKSEIQKNGDESKFDGFKKPLLPISKNKTEGSRINNTVKPKTKIKNGLSQSDLNITGKTQNNLNKTEVIKEGNIIKMIESSLTKSGTAKRSCSIENKPKKKPRFVVPVAATHKTCQETALKRYTITVLDDVSAREILEKFNSDTLEKVVITITFKEGYTLLNKPQEQRKNSQCFPSGIMFLAHWASNRREYYWLHLLDINPADTSIRAVMQNFFSKPENIICFETQAVFMLLMDVFHTQNISSWFAMDPLVGCWLLDPDNPPKDFLETSVKLDMDESLLVVNPKADTKTQACDLLPVLEVAMDLLKHRLTNASLWTLFLDMEMRLTPLLAIMESSSILVDVKKLHETATILEKHLKRLEKEAHKLANKSFQINSHLQLRQILFEDLKLDTKFNITVKKTEQGSKSTSETVLLQFKDLHPLPKIVLNFRQLQKVKSTYVDGLIQHIKPDGTIGTTWEQVGAATGRITSKNPNLQAIPKVPVMLPDGEKLNLRAVFKAREGYSFLAADFQQIEFRVFAHFTQDNSLIKAFQEGGDIFQWLAQRWLGGTGPEEREKTKRIVYSVMYGASAYKLAEYLQVDVGEATRIINNFVDTFPSLRSLPKTVITQCRTQGFVSTLSGRRRLFPNIRAPNYKLRSYSERQAMNFLIQGSAADICKAAMLDCDVGLQARGLDAKLLLQIHDELVWEVADQHLQETASAVRTAMEHHWGERLLLKVPVPVCITSSKTLGDMNPLVSK